MYIDIWTEGIDIADMKCFDIKVSYLMTLISNWESMFNLDLFLALEYIKIDVIMQIIKYVVCLNIVKYCFYFQENLHAPSFH